MAGWILFMHLDVKNQEDHEAGVDTDIDIADLQTMAEMTETLAKLEEGKRNTKCQWKKTN